MDQGEAVAAMEEEIEELAEAAAKCRKIDIAAKALSGAGALVLVLLFLGLLRLDAAAALAAISAVLIGIVLFGSNRSTQREIEAKIRALEARRSETIDAIGPRSVGGPRLR